MALRADFAREAALAHKATAVHLLLVASLLLLVARPGAPSSFLLLVVRHLLLEARHLFLVASLLLVAMPFVISSVPCYY